MWRWSTWSDHTPLTHLQTLACLMWTLRNKSSTLYLRERPWKRHSPCSADRRSRRCLASKQMWETPFDKIEVLWPAAVDELHKGRCFRPRCPQTKCQRVLEQNAEQTVPKASSVNEQMQACDVKLNQNVFYCVIFLSLTTKHFAQMSPLPQ